MTMRLLARRLLKPLLCVAAIAALTTSAAAQSTWTGAVNSNWTTAGNWDTPPVSGVDTEIIFDGATNVNTVNDFPGVFQLSSISNAFSASQSFSINGNPLQLVGGGVVSPAINNNSANATLRIQVPLTLASGVVNTVFMATNTFPGAELFLTGPITSTPGTTLNVTTGTPGNITLMNAPNNTNFVGTLSIGSSAIVQIGAHNAIWRRTAVVLAPSGISVLTTGTTTAAGFGTPDAGYNVQVASMSGFGQFLVGTTNSSSTALVGFSNANTTVNGPASFAGFNINSHYGKVGTGVLTVQSDNESLNMAISVRDGGITLSTSGTGRNGVLTNSLPNAGSLSVYQTGILRLQNTTSVPTTAQQRLSDTAPMRLAGGILRNDGNPTTAVNELLGPLQVITGQSTVVVNTTSATGANSTLRFASVSEGFLNRGGQVLFVGPGLGSTVSGAGTGNIRFTAAPTLSNGIIPWGVAQTTYANNLAGVVANTFAPDTFAELGPEGVRPLTTFAADNDFGAGPTSNARATAAVIAPGGAVNTILLTGAATLTVGSSLAVSSGAVMNNAAAGSISGPGPLTATGRMYMTANAPLTVSTPIQALGLSKGGSSVLTVNSAVTLSGTAPFIVAVNQGSLIFGTGSSVSPASAIFQISRGTSITLPGPVTGTLRGSGTVNGPVTLAPGSLLGGSSLGGMYAEAGNTSAAPGTMFFNGPVTMQGGTPGPSGQRIRFYITSAFGADSSTPALAALNYTQSLLYGNAGSSLNLTAASPSNPITVQPQSMLLTDAGNGDVYDFVNTQEYVWPFAHFPTGTITGFSADKFFVDTSLFTNALAPLGNFSVTFTSDASGDKLNLFYNPVPEPTLLGGLAAIAGFALLRRRKA